MTTSMAPVAASGRVSRTVRVVPAGATSSGAAGAAPAGPKDRAASAAPATAATFTTTAEMPELGSPALPPATTVVRVPGSTADPASGVPSSRATSVG